MYEDLMSGWLADAPTAHDDGHFISAKVSRIVELIREYDPRLDVKWIPPEHREPGDAVFSIIERTSDGKEHIAFHVQSEEEFNESVLARIYAADVDHNDVLGRVEANNRAIRDADAARKRDAMEERHDLMRTLLASPKHNFRHDGKEYRK